MPKDAVGRGFEVTETYYIQLTDLVSKVCVTPGASPPGVKPQPGPLGSNRPRAKQFLLGPNF